MCHNINMKENSYTQDKVIEPEILDESGQRIAAPGDPAAPRTEVYRGAGVLTGFFALAFSFVMILLGALVTVFVIAPLLLLGRLLGMQVKTFHR